MDKGNFYNMKNMKTGEIKSVFIVDNKLNEFYNSNPDWSYCKNHILYNTKSKNWRETKEFFGTIEDAYVYVKEHPKWSLRQPVKTTTGIIGDWNWRERLKREQPEFAEMMKSKSRLAPRGSEFVQKWG